MFDWLQLVKKEISLDVKCISSDNSGENKSFHQNVQRSNDNIKFEFTAPGTPQKNGKVERAFATLYGKTRFMLNSARHLQHYLVKLGLCSTQLDLLQLSDKDSGQAEQA
jgi:transposase InsO family protein